MTTENPHTLATSRLFKLRGTSHAADVDTPRRSAAARRSPAARPLGRSFRTYCSSLQHAITFELETIKGVLMEVVDNGLRMLTPRELANGQGFPRDYVLNPVHAYTNVRGKTVLKPLSNSDQVRMIGNSVCPPVAAALLRANNPELARSGCRW